MCGGVAHHNIIVKLWIFEGATKRKKRADNIVYEKVKGREMMESEERYVVGERKKGRVDF